MTAARQPRRYTAEQAARILQEVDSASSGDDDEEIQIEDTAHETDEESDEDGVENVGHTIGELHICCLRELVWSGSELLARETSEEWLQKMCFHNGLVQHHWHIKQLKLRVL